MSELEKARIKVMESVGYVQKHGNNAQQNYRYASDADLLRVLRPAMVENGLTLTPSGIDDAQITERRAANKQGHETINYITTAKVHFDLRHTSGEVQHVCVLAQGSDAMDKGAYKLMTGAIKYALRQSFLIETGDDPEKEADATEKRRALTDDEKDAIIGEVNRAASLDALKAAWENYSANEGQFTTEEADAEVRGYFTKRRTELKGAKNA